MVWKRMVQQRVDRRHFPICELRPNLGTRALIDPPALMRAD
jgi:hypothetical protein